MEANPRPPALVAVDTNVLLDLADELEDVTDAVGVMRRRLRPLQFLMSPTVEEELAHEVLHGNDFTEKERASSAFALARRWNIHLARLLDGQHQTARAMGRRLRAVGLLPEAEVNDGLIVAETALLGSALLLTSDEHLRGMDFERLTFELRAFRCAAPVIATPREIARKFFQ
ncbi:MAG: hypothetical protein HY043_17180 [Verrucomicrobia bacterium]|nr:hypothetical protein [Verrucomicrobiota bacterium]